VPTRSKAPSQESVDRLVTSYLIDKVKEHSDADNELFDSLLALHELAVEREASHDPSHRLEQVKENPLVQGAVAVMGQRVQRLLDVGLRIAQDTQLLRRKLREHLTEEGINPDDPKQREAADLAYERVLAETVPLDVALGNTEALADLIDLANDVLNAGSAPKQMVYEMAWKAFKRTLFKDDHVLDRMERIKSGLQGDRERLARIARLVRTAGPGVVKDAYTRAGKAADRRRSEEKKAAAPRPAASKPVAASKASGGKAAGARPKRKSS